MLQKLKDIGGSMMTAYRNYKNGDCRQITGNFNISMRLHKKSAPDSGANLTTDGSGSVALIDVLLVMSGLMLVGCLLRGICCICRKF